jgi:hypothetical protein
MLKFKVDVPETAGDALDEVTVVGDAVDTAEA